MKAIQLNILLVVFVAFSTPMTKTASADGTATLLGKYSLSRPGLITDVWGYVDPVTSREYALIGQRDRNIGVTIIDVTDPANPIFVAEAADIEAFDIKTWDHYMYVVTGSIGTNRGRIFDLTDISSPQYAGAINSSHNLFIDQRGLMYQSLTGLDRELQILDLSTNPTLPELLWSTGPRSPHDAFVVGSTLYDFHGSAGTKIYDMTAARSPFLLAEIRTGTFHHSGMPTEDGKHLLITHELNVHPSPDITIWNIEDLTNPRLVAEIKDPSATVHNLFIVGDFAYASYYTAGFRIYDVSDPTTPLIVDEYDTSAHIGEVWKGCWGVFPFTPSGNIYVSDVDNGLFVFSFSDRSATPFITSFSAAYTRGRVLLEWRISNTSGLQGFNVYRSDNPSGGFQKINSALIAPAAVGMFEDPAVVLGQTYWYYLGAVDSTSDEKPSSTLSVFISRPTFVLHQNAPNPFNPKTAIDYEIPTASHVDLVVFNAVGQKVRTLVNEFRTEGAHATSWDGLDDRLEPVSSGVYFARLSALGKSETMRMVLVR